MQSKWHPVAQGYFKREHPYALPIFDDYGLSDDNSFYYDLDRLSEEERKQRERMMALVTREFVATMEENRNADITYVPGGITSGVRPAMWIFNHNETHNFDPDHTITTTYKVDRHMGGAVMKKVAIDPNVEDNLRFGAIQADRFPNHHPLVPVIREQATKEMVKDPNLTNGQTYEGEDFMAFWSAMIDFAKNDSYNGEPLHSRNTDHEVMRGLLLQAGLVPMRPDADMNFPDSNGTPKRTIDILRDGFEVLKFQVGAGIKPKEIATLLARMGDIFDHLQGKKNKISEARTKANMSAFPEKIHPEMHRWITEDAAAYKDLRTEIDAFIKTYAASYLRNIHELDSKYEKWVSEGYGRLPAYTDGMHKRLRRRLTTVKDIARHDVGGFFDKHNPHPNQFDAQGVAGNREQLIEAVQEMALDFSTIRLNYKNGHWNPTLKALGNLINDAVRNAELLETAATDNHERVQRLATEIKETTIAVQNKITAMLDDKTIPQMRANAKEIGERALEMLNQTQNKPVNSKARMGIDLYDPAKDPMDNNHKGKIFVDILDKTLEDRHAAELKFMVNAQRTLSPKLAEPYSIHVSVDPKTMPDNGAFAKQDGVGGVKQAFGAAGKETSREFTSYAQEQCDKIVAWMQHANPNTTITDSFSDIRVFNTIKETPEATAKPGSAAWSTEAKLLYTSKRTQMRGKGVIFGHGWWRNETQVMERMRCIEMQLGGFERPHDTTLDIYTAPENMKKPRKRMPKPDTLYESIAPLAEFVAEEFEAGRKVPKNTVLCLIRMLETHAMLSDPELTKRIKDPAKRFNAQTANTNLVSYMNDARRGALGHIKKNGQSSGLYQYLCQDGSGLLMEPALIRHISREYLNDPVIGDRYAKAQDNAKGKQTLGITRKPVSDIIHVDPGMHI